MSITTENYQEIKLNNKNYKVKKHWFWDEYESNGWEPQTYKNFQLYINPQTTYVDIGAWLGTTLLYAAQQNPKSIYAVEANPLSYSMIKENCSLNPIIENTKLFNICITDKDNQLVKFGGSNNQQNTSSASSIRGNCWEIKSCTLTSFLKQNNLTDCDNLFIKIDIEGAEELLLNDFDLLKHKENLTIFLSLHPPFMNNKQEFSSKFLDICSKYKAIYNSNLEPLSLQKLEKMILTNENNPEWGTKFGNFFEILLTNSSEKKERI